MTGLVLYGINNIYTVRISAGPEGYRTLMCRIKGKVLKDSVDEYNPIAVGDSVVLDDSCETNGTSLIVERLPRKSEFVRWNKKREAPQTLAANIDTVLCVTSPVSPPFRPRFIDRVLVMAARGGITPVILLNKIDQQIDSETAARLAYYEEMGYLVLYSSAATGKGINTLKKHIADRMCAFIGQSGVGKSTLLNALCPGVDRVTGEISRKYNRGRHTTNYSILIPEGSGGIIDTPGIREIDVFGIEPADLESYFPDILANTGDCEYAQCTHIHEPGCGVRKAVEEGEIHYDRYESYGRIHEYLETLQRVKYE